jgi:hypothetical protein
MRFSAIRPQNVTLAKVALDWLLAQKSWIVPIPGTKRERLEESVGAARVELSAADLRSIEQAAAALVVRGPRYPDRPPDAKERWSRRAPEYADRRRPTGETSTANSPANTLTSVLKAIGRLNQIVVSDRRKLGDVSQPLR